MSLLPPSVDYEHYWRDVYHQPLPFWEAALRHVAAQHGLSTDGWTRAALGRNVVFLHAEAIIKFGPPCWAGDITREAAALQFVAGRLPIATPTLLAVDVLDGWEYLIQARLPGTNLWELWKALSSAQRAALAHQHGELMAALHALPVDSAPPLLGFDWKRMLVEQRAACAAALAASGVDAALAAHAASYVAAAEPLLTNDTAHVLLHGDLSHLNFLVTQHGDHRWQITALIDWGDAKIGPRTHELISPGVHMYRGDGTVLDHWYRGYGWDATERTAQHEHLIMVRAMLGYADEFAAMIEAVPGAAQSSDWEAVAHAFWHLRA